MRRDTGDKKVKKEPHLALRGKKYLGLFFAFTVSIFFANNARAELTPIPDEQAGKTIMVQASVPLMPEFIYSIQKNSSLKLTKAAFALGEEINVQVKIIGGNDFPLRGHKINLQVLNARGSAASNEKILFVLSGETDNDGIARFSFSADEHLFGTHTLRVVDITYGEAIVISKEKTFIVYKPADGQRGRELTEQKIIISQSLTPKQIPSGEVSITSANADTSQKNATIIADHQTEIVRKWSNDP